MKRKRYRAEFKDEACKLVIEQGRTPAEVARELGIVAQTLGHWLRARGYQTSIEHQPAAVDSDDPAVLKAQVHELTARVRRLETEKEILKKATAYFASQQN
jgi:transposase